jgi:hypothetical protein
MFDDAPLLSACCIAGSGTVLIAAERIGRKARALEIDPHYVNVAVKRWQHYTGKDAVLSASGKTFEEVGEERARDSAARPVQANPTTALPGLGHTRFLHPSYRSVESIVSKADGPNSAPPVDPAKHRPKGDYEVGHCRPAAHRFGPSNKAEAKSGEGAANCVRPQ